MEIAKVFDKDSIDKVADNLFSAVSNSVSEVKAMQQRKAAENVQLVIQALKKIESEIQNKFDGVTGTMEKRIANIRDGRNGTDGRDGRDGKDGKPGRDGAPGPRGPAGVAGKDGKDGKDGISVTNAKIDFDGSLIISLSNGREVNVGEVIDPGLQERIKYISNGGAVPQYILDTLTSLQAQITALQNLGAVNYVGTWNATTNSPAITGGTGDKGDYYVVNVAGNTTIDGQSNWGVGDWIIFNGTAWQKVDGGDTGNLTNLNVSGTTTLSALTASQAVFTNASKELVSNAVTGTGNVVMSTSPVLTTPNLGTPSAATLTNATGLPIGTGVSGLGTGVATALAVNTGSSGAFVVNGGALGTPSSGTVTNLTGTASININGTVGATTANSGAFTTLTTSSTVTHNGGTANGVAYLNGSKVLTTGSALTFDGTTLTNGGNIVALGGDFSGQGASGYVQLRAGSSDTNTMIIRGASAGARFEYVINGSEQMRLTSTGLGIGTSSPAAKADVVGTVRATSQTVPASGTGAELFYDATNAGLRGYNRTGSAYVNLALNDNVYVGGGSGGNVGIGTSSPSVKLDVNGNAKIKNTLTLDRYGDATEYLTISSNGNGIYNAVSLNHVWQTSGTERMRLDSFGNLGLGVTPSAWSVVGPVLQVSTAAFYGYANQARVTANAYFDGSAFKYIASAFASEYRQTSGQHQWLTAPSGTAGNAITFTQAMTLTAAGRLGIGQTSPGVALSVAGASEAWQLALTTASGTSGAVIGSPSADVLAFGNWAGTERARITSGGDVYIGTSTALSSTAKLQISNGTGRAISTAGSSGDVGTEGLRIGKFDNDSTTSQLFVRFTINNDGSGSGQINANGASAAAFGTYSDARLKENIVSLPSQLSNICALRPVEFDYKDGSGHQIGFIAQEMQAVYPDVVAPGDDEMLMVTGWSKTEARLVKAIQELKAEVDSLKAQLKGA